MAAVLAITFTWPVCAQDSPITPDNWMSHPQIVATRAVYNEVTIACKEKTCTAFDRTVSSMGEYVFRKIVHVDPAFRIRLLEIDQGDEGGTYHAAIYYDSLSRLRFIFVEMETYDNDAPEDQVVQKTDFRIYYPISPDPFRIPMWVVKSENGKYTELGTEVDVSDEIQEINVRQPYVEFHDND